MYSEGFISYKTVSNSHLQSLAISFRVGELG